MHVLSLALLVAAAQTPPEEPKAPPAPVPVTSPEAARPAAVPAPPRGAAAAPAFAPPGGGAMSAAAIERMGQGDRAFLDRDFRNALFAYTDAAYLATTSAGPRIKMGRAYLALRYPERAIEQAEKALALDPGNADARKLIEEARNAAASAPPAAAAATPPAASPSARVYRYVPEAEAAPAAVPVPATVAVPVTSAPEPVRPTPASAVAPPAQGGTAAQRYRQGLDQVRDREFEKAIATFSEAVSLDPRLAVAYAARASARFALGGYREAADDYRKAIDLDAKLATPLYGLAECHRVLGERKEAAEMYRRYAESRAPDVRDDLRAAAAKRAEELR